MLQLKIQTSRQNKVKYWIFLLLILIVGGGIFIYSNLNKPVTLNPKKYVEYEGLKHQEIDLVNISDFEKQIRKVSWNEIDAKSIYAINPSTGKIYFAKNEDVKRPIASITKLMTILTSTFEYEEGQSIQIKSSMPKMDNPAGLKVGDSIQLEDVRKCALIESNNDCANTFAYQYPTGFDSYISKMNEYAQILGMINSHFSNPSGFVNIDNYSTASDLGKLASAIVRNEEIVKITDMPSGKIKIGNKTVNLTATNVMLKENKNIRGLKTGFTYASGECLVLYYDFGNDEKLITVVLDASDRFRESRELYNLILKAFN